MKKIQILALSAVVACGAFITSCNGGLSSNASLKTEVDTVSYAYGVSMYEQGLAGHMQQLGVIADTMAVSMEYQSKIDAETDAAKKAELQKKFKSVMDSVVKANARNKAEFLKGIQEAISANDAQAAYHAGIVTGGEMTGKFFPYFVQQLYGAKGDAKKDINKEAFMAGMIAAANKDSLAMKDPSGYMEGKMRAAQEKVRAEQVAEMKMQYAEQIAAGNKFMADNKTKAGVITTPSGLEYKIVKEGTGPKPTKDDIVKVHYHGTLMDGTVFDSSVQRKEPAMFGVGQVIPGWTEALQLMPVGSKWIVYVPAELGYNEQAQGAIQPFSPLIFEVELLSIENPAAMNMNMPK